MPGSVKIGWIAGTAIRIHITYLLLWILGGIEAGWDGLPLIVLPFASVIAHQFGHIIAARTFKIKATDITLGPIGEVARLDRIPEKLSEAFFVAIAGPLVNVIIAAVALIAAKATELSAQNLPASESIVAFISNRLAMMNLFLAAFNMIPALPMDGGRMLRALLAIRLGYARAAEIASAISQWTAFALGTLGLFYNPRLIIVAIFIFLGARAIKTTPLGW